MSTMQFSLVRNYHETLTVKFPYYTKLTEKGKKKFLFRMHQFIAHKNFIGRDGLIVVDEMKILIAASAVQLTFGLSEYIIPTIRTVNVFPKTFYSKLYNTSFKGLTSQGGVLSLSWQDFEHGYFDLDDRYNLGLHEMAHALKIDAAKDHGYYKNFDENYEKWHETALKEFQNINHGRTSFLRDYAGKNMHEFFAVCVEHFFELPMEFKHRLPELYNNLKTLLNQDPENTSVDYSLKNQLRTSIVLQRETVIIPIEHYGEMDDSILNDRVKNFLAKNGLIFAMVATGSGLFIGIPFIFHFESELLSSGSHFFPILLLASLLGAIKWRWVKDYIRLERYHYMMYAITGFGIWVTVLVFFLNTLLITGYSAQTYKMKGAYQQGSNYYIILNDQEETQYLNNNFTFPVEEYESSAPEAKYVDFYCSKSFMGFKKVVAVGFSNSNN